MTDLCISALSISPVTIQIGPVRATESANSKLLQQSQPHRLHIHDEELHDDWSAN